MKDDVVDAAVRVSPPVAVTAYHAVTGMTLNDWVAIATLIYIVLQAVLLVRKELLMEKKDEN